MKTMKVFLLILSLGLYSSLIAQEKCASTPYLQEQIARDPQLTHKHAAIEKFTEAYTSNQLESRLEITSSIIKIPVVVHVLYHNQDEKISVARIQSQIDALNKHFQIGRASCREREKISETAGGLKYKAT